MFNRSQQQKQLMLDRQRLKQLQDQEYSNTTFCSLLCTLETIYLKEMKMEKNYQHMFKYYDPLKSREFKDLNDLYSHANTQLLLFSTSHQLYCEEWTKYDFPKNFQNHQAYEFVQNLATCPNLRIYADALDAVLRMAYRQVKIPQNNRPPVHKVEFTYEQLAQTIPMILCYGQELGDSVQKSYEKDPENFAVAAKIHADPTTHPLVKKQKIYENINVAAPEILPQSVNKRDEHKYCEHNSIVNENVSDKGNFSQKPQPEEMVTENEGESSPINGKSEIEYSNPSKKAKRTSQNQTLSNPLPNPLIPQTNQFNEATSLYEINLKKQQQRYPVNTTQQYNKSFLKPIKYSNYTNFYRKNY
jgi:hypothetical protein